jgi:sensor domain CHASE-containing protein
MKLRTKALLAVSLGVALLLLLLQAVFSLVLMENFKSLEEQQVTQNLRRVQQALAEKSAAIPLRLIDWANWDDAYQFMEDHNQEFIDANLVTEGLSGLEMNFLLFFDRENRLFEAKSLDFRHRLKSLCHMSFSKFLFQPPLYSLSKRSPQHTMAFL